MNNDFFKKTRILDGGMGQELLARGMEPNGTLWSADALLQKISSSFIRCTFKFYKIRSRSYRN